MFCKNCGKEIDDKASVCIYCGVSTEKEKMLSDDTGNIGAGIASCCFPIVGLILYFVWKDSKPKSAKHACYGALISVACGVIFYMIYILFIAALFSSY